MSTDNNGGIQRPDGKVNPIDTDYQIGQDNVALKVGPFGLDIHNRVFAISGMSIILFVVLTLTFRQQVEPFFAGLRGWLVSNLDWFFLSAGNVFVVCVILIPSTVCVLWMTAFGGTAISQYVNDGYQAVFDAELPLKLFAMLDVMPLSQITSIVGIILVVVFFITSADSGSLVIDTIAAGGKVDAPTPQRVFWCTFEGLVAIALMLGGGLAAAQAMAVTTGLPFTIVLLVATVSLVKGLMDEPRPTSKSMKKAKA
ncbi:TPA: BCCT family transporter [Vibrio campbellii]